MRSSENLTVVQTALKQAIWNLDTQILVNLLCIAKQEPKDSCFEKIQFCRLCNKVLGFLASGEVCNLIATDLFLVRVLVRLAYRVDGGGSESICTYE